MKPRPHLSKYLNKVAKGETLLLCKRNVPVAEVRAIPSVRRKRRPALGLGKGEVVIHDSFFDPMPDELLELFEGRAKP